MDDGCVFACNTCAEKNPELPWKALASELAQRAGLLGVTMLEIAHACTVRESSARHWWYGERIPNRHASAIRMMLGADAQASIWRSFREGIGPGRRAADGGRLTLVRAARVLRGAGDYELATQVAARAEAIGEAGR